jgi:hypothetical protein
MPIALTQYATHYKTDPDAISSAYYKSLSSADAASDFETFGASYITAIFSSVKSASIFSNFATVLWTSFQSERPTVPISNDTTMAATIRNTGFQA